MDEDTGGQLEILAVQRYWSKNTPSIGGVFGGGIFFASNSGEESITDTFDPWEFETGAFGLLGQAGVAGKIGKNIVVEVLPYLGVGGAVTEVTTSTGASDDGSGSYFMYGVKGGIFVQLSQSIELGVEIGYQGISVDVEVDGGSDIELSGDGARGAAVLAIKF
jgi:opacity protein-like surface antigen